MIYAKHKNMRNAFSMITAIFVIVIMASIASFVLNLAGKVTKETVTQFQNEQAILYAKSYTEFAVMAATSRNCIKKIVSFVGTTKAKVFEGEGYRITVDIQYVGSDLNPNFACKTIGGSISTADSKGGTVLIDTYVRYRDRDIVGLAIDAGVAADANNLPWTTYHRRTLQRL
jgi:type II secretory pathway pseudopilin PulG